MAEGEGKQGEALIADFMGFHIVQQQFMKIAKGRHGQKRGRKRRSGLLFQSQRCTGAWFDLLVGGGKESGE